MHRLCREEKINFAKFNTAVGLAKAAGRLDLKNKDGDTALHVLLKSSLEVGEKEKRLVILLEAGADVNAKDKKGQVPLWWGEDHVALLKVLLQYKVSPLMGSGVMGSGEHIMLRAVADNRLGVLRALLAHDPGLVDVCNDNGGPRVTMYGREGIRGDYWTPLHMAVANRKKEVVELLIKAGADVNAKHTYWWPNGSLMGEEVTPIQMAQSCGYDDLVRYLNKFASP